MHSVPQPTARSLILLGAALALAFPRLGAQSTNPGPLATVDAGTLQGRDLAKGGAVFKGVPFALPPVGEFRWREPQPVVPWQGIRDAGRSGPPAAQPPLGWNNAAAAAGSEDCLYLDVWTPSPGRGGALPVMVWIHGGGNVAGAGGFDPLYDGQALISRGVVLVVVEYRLGIFGFFSHPELTAESAHHASGNYALLDQIAALRWVKANISQFGGDPANVTIFGQSAGSTDVLALVASPLAAGLFEKAIGESGPLPDAAQSPTLAEAERLGTATAARLEAPDRGALAYLRSLSTGDLLKARFGLRGLEADGWVLPSFPANRFAQGLENRVPAIIGGAAIEFPADGGPGRLRAQISERFGPLAPRALALYGLAADSAQVPADPLYGNAADQWGSDLFRCPAVVEAGWHSVGNPTWTYQFERAIPPRPRTGHSSDLPYVFGNLRPDGGQGGQFGPDDRALSDIIQGYWTNFARTGNPNGPGLPLWPQYTLDDRNYLRFTTAASVAVDRDQRGPFVALFREEMAASAAAH